MPRLNAASRSGRSPPRPGPRAGESAGPGLAATVAIAATLALLAAAVGTGWAERRANAAGWALVALSAEAGLAVRSIVFIGRERSDVHALRRAVGIVEGTPILAIDPAGVRARVARLPWVDEVEVERSLPDMVVVRIVERRPFAIRESGGRFEVMDDRGRTVEGIDAARFPRLPVVKGDGAPDRAPTFLAMLADEPDLAARVTGLTLVSGRRWNVYLDRSIEIKLPERNAGLAWTRLADIVRERQILDGSIAAIDLRIDGRAVLRPAAPPASGRS